MIRFERILTACTTRGKQFAAGMSGDSPSHGAVSTSSVSVVIPTRGRPESVVAAVRSAQQQTVRPHEIIVVIDGPDEATLNALESLGDPRLRIVPLASSLGAGAARNAGVAAATSRWIAFLDDDDVWLESKLATQLAHLADLTEPDGHVVGCQVLWNDGRRERVWPTRAPRAGEPVAHYLFIRRHAGEGLLPTPSIMLSRERALATPFPTHLRTHEEWDWFLDLERNGSSFTVVTEPLVRVDARPHRSSVSSDATWRFSLAWALNRADHLGPEALSAFVLNEVARNAVASRAPVRALVAILAVGLTGRPGFRDVVRFFGRPLRARR